MKGEFEKQATSIHIEFGKLKGGERTTKRNLVRMEDIDEARKDFALSEDDLFDLEEYGFEDDAKLTKGAIELKVEILQKVAKKYLRINKKWFGSGKKVKENRCNPPADCKKCAYAPQDSELCKAELVAWTSKEPKRKGELKCRVKFN